MTNTHLNIHQPYSQANNAKENNYSRGLALCLMHDPVFLQTFIIKILGKLPESLAKDSIQINIQQGLAGKDAEDFNSIIGIALTPSSLESPKFLRQKAIPNKEQITDLFIQVNDIAIIIEVKKYQEEHVFKQLSNQINLLLDTPPNQQPASANATSQTQVKLQHLSWGDVLQMMETSLQFEKITNQANPFVHDFIRLCKSTYANWFNPKPLSQIPWDKPGKRIRFQQAIQQSELLQGLENNRLGLALNAKWANELLISYDNDKQEVHFLLYPGNTKQQGYHLYKNGEVKLPANHTLVINDITFSMDTKVHLKFSHFNKYVTDLTFDPEEALIKPITTKQNFNKYAGKWDKARWPQFYKFLDEHFKSDYNWQTKAHWQSSFEKSNRSYFTFSLGYKVKLIVGYEFLQNIDNNNLGELSSFIEQVQDKMIEFVESNISI